MMKTMQHPNIVTYKNSYIYEMKLWVHSLRFLSCLLPDRDGIHGRRIVDRLGVVSQADTNDGATNTIRCLERTSNMRDVILRLLGFKRPEFYSRHASHSQRH
jgi:hypothetical protein